MRGLEGKNINNPLHKLIIPGLEKLGHNQLITLQYLIQRLMHPFLLILYRVVKNDLKPGLTHVQLRDRVVLYYLPYQVISAVKGTLEGLVLDLVCLVYLFEDLYAHPLQDYEQFLADL